jgi:hypothetical protein
MILSIMALNSVILRVIYAECHEYVHYAVCHYTECRGAVFLMKLSTACSHESCSNVASGKDFILKEIVRIIFISICLESNRRRSVPVDQIKP